MTAFKSFIKIFFKFILADLQQKLERTTLAITGCYRLQLNLMQFNVIIFNKINEHLLQCSLILLKMFFVHAVRRQKLGTNLTVEQSATCTYSMQHMSTNEIYPQVFSY